MTPIPPLRIRELNAHSIRPDGDYVIYWMTAFRRPRWNFALQRAVDHARALDKPLIVFEPLRCDYPWASDRHHRFVIDGMAANQEAFKTSPVTYYPYVEPTKAAGKGLLEALARGACLVVADDYPCFFLPRMLDAAAAKLTCAMEAVDSNGLVPLRLTDRAYSRAVDFRRFLHDQLPGLIDEAPAEDPLLGAALPQLSNLPTEITRRWTPATATLLAGSPEPLAALPIDHTVRVVLGTPGGHHHASQRLARFVAEDLDAYGSRSRDLLDPPYSGLSPYLHFGHISTHEVLNLLLEREGWTPALIDRKKRSKNEGFWGISPPVESFLDELLTWRELGYNGAANMPNFTRYEGLPGWAQASLEKHTDDPREHLYDLATLEAAQTQDELWNATQRQLVETGVIHSYLRMLWGKKILEWTQNPRQAIDFMIELNNKYALDGRDPNSYSGIFWTLGRYDRAWGPERPIYGKIRYMSSESTRRKFSTPAYLSRYGG